MFDIFQGLIKLSTLIIDNILFLLDLSIQTSDVLDLQCNFLLCFRQLLSYLHQLSNIGVKMCLAWVIHFLELSKLSTCITKRGLHLFQTLMSPFFLLCIQDNLSSTCLVYFLLFFREEQSTLWIEALKHSFFNFGKDRW